jgi:hypothetical protein
MGLNKLVTATFVTLCGAFTLSSNVASAQDVPANAPIVAAPGSNQSAGGPTVWNANQETSALSGDRTLDPEYQAKGIPLGVFRLFPTLNVSANYDDNVFRQPGNQQSDFFFVETPSLLLDYETSDAHVDLYADGTFDQYTKLTTVDVPQYDFGTKGSYLVSRELQVSGNISFSQLAESLSSADTIASQDQPNLYTLFDVSGQAQYKPNRLGFTFGGSRDAYHYFDTPLFGGGSLYNGDRSNTVVKGFGQGSYDFSPGYSGYVKATYNNDTFEQFFDRSGYHRDSHGYQVDAGVNLLLGNLVQGTAYIGYIDQMYDHQQQAGLVPLKDISGLDFGADLTWYPTELLTVKLTASRQIVNTTFAGASGGDDRNVNLSATYEVTRQMFLTGSFGYDDTEYPGAGTVATPTLEETTPTFGVGVKYIISHYAQVQLNYNYSTRSSTPLSGLAFNDNLVSLGLNLQI